MYNRWTYSDELYHHGVLGQRKGKRNGPPYPLYRQERFKSQRPDGSPITSKKAYKKAMQVERAQKKEERSSHPKGTAEDRKERDSVAARFKRAYRQYRNEQKETVERNRVRKEAYDKAKERLDKSYLPEDRKKKLLEDTKNWKSNDDSAKKINDAIDKYETEEREAAKSHGTAEEVMKFRESFSKDEWKEIADRLEQENRVRKLTSDTTSGQQNQNNKGGNQQGTSFVPEKFNDKKTQKIYDRGRATTVWKNRDKFTPEQLNSIAARIEAEDKIAKYANNSVDPKGNAALRFEKIVDILSTMGKGAEAISKIKKLFPEDK